MPRRFVLCAIILTLLMTAASCGEQNESGSTDGSNTPNAVQNNGQTKPPGSPLVVYVQNYSLAQESVEIFNAGGYGTTIKPVYYSYEQANEIYRGIEAELASGEGPDIIVASSYQLPHLTKLIQNGSFCDMNELIKEDDAFNPGDYFEKVLKCGVVNGARYIMPLTFYIDSVLMTTRQTLEDDQFSIDGRYLSFGRLSDMAKEFVLNHPDDERFLLDIAYIPSLSGTADYFSENILTDSGKLSQYLKQYMSIYKTAYFSIGKEIITNSEFYSLLPENRISFMLGAVYGFDSMPTAYSGFQSEVIPEIFAVTMSEDHDAAIVKPAVIAAVNNRCGNKQAAFELIKIMMSEERQRYYPLGLPINKAAYEGQREAFINNPELSVASKPPSKGYVANSSGIRESETAEYLVRQIEEILGGDIEFSLMDRTISSTLYNDFTALLSGEKTAEEAVMGFQKSINDYMKGDIHDYISPAATPPPDMPVLTIQYMDGDSAVRNAVKAFNEGRKDIRIEETVYSSNSREEHINKLMTDIMAGEGPDIIYFDAYMFNSLAKTVSTGVFCDLNELIAADDTFNSLDLNQRVLESGVYGDKRFYIPLRYELPLLLTTKSIMDKGGIAIDESNWTLDGLRKMIVDYAGNTGNKYFINSNLLFRFIVNGCGRDFIDHGAKRAEFNSHEFIELMKFYKDIYPYITSAEQGMSYASTEAMLQNHTIAMNFSFIHSPKWIWSDNSEYYTVFGEEPLLYPLPGFMPGNDVPVEIMYAASINQNCANKQAALDFIEILLSEDIQKAQDKNGNSNYILGFPVNNGALRAELSAYTDAAYGGLELSNGTQRFTSVPLSESLASRIIDITNRTCAGPEIDMAVYGIINDGMRSYLDGKRTAEQAAEDINNKVNLFLNE